MIKQAALSRLFALAADNIEAGERMKAQAPRFLAYKERHLLGTAPKAVTGFNLFQTPRIVAGRMADIIKAEIKPGARILEPSAGLGRLVEPFADFEEMRLQWEAVEEVGECVRAMRKGFRQLQNAREGDFLGLSCSDLGGEFDAVIMNPPFKNGTDIKHILHAREMLKPGGVLVSLCYDGVKQNRDLKPLAATWEQLPPASFKQEGTAADVVLLTIRN